MPLNICGWSDYKLAGYRIENLHPIAFNDILSRCANIRKDIRFQNIAWDVQLISYGTTDIQRAINQGCRNDSNNQTLSGDRFIQVMRILSENLRETAKFLFEKQRVTHAETLFGFARWFDDDASCEIERCTDRVMSIVDESLRQLASSVVPQAVINIIRSYWCFNK